MVLLWPQHHPMHCKTTCKEAGATALQHNSLQLHAPAVVCCEWPRCIWLPRKSLPAAVTTGFGHRLMRQPAVIQKHTTHGVTHSRPAVVFVEREAAALQQADRVWCAMPACDGVHKHASWRFSRLLRDTAGWQ
jgi:hypothetical protein